MNGARTAPPLVGLTGGIGAGKSEALAAFGRLGASVLSTDAVVHELYADPEVVGAVVERWGDDVAPGGVVDRAEVARKAFAGSDERLWLEGLLWPRVGARMMAWRDEQARREPPPPALVVEVPLLFEAGMEGAFDLTVAVVADEDIRARRAGARGHEVLDERAARQLTQQEKSELADHVVANSGTISELERTLWELLEKLRAAPE